MGRDGDIPVAWSSPQCDLTHRHYRHVTPRWGVVVPVSPCRRVHDHGTAFDTGRRSDVRTAIRPFPEGHGTAAARPAVRCRHRLSGGRRSRDHRRRRTRRRPATLPDGTTVPTEAIEAPASVSLPRLGRPRRRRQPRPRGPDRVRLRHPGRRPRRLPARRDGHQRRRQVLQHLVAADRRDRPGRVRPRPLRRQHAQRRRPRDPRHLRHRPRRHQQHPGHPRHRRRPVRRRRPLGPRGRPDAVHPLDLVGRRRRR